MSRTFRRVNTYHKLSDLQKLIKQSDIHKGDENYINHIFEIASRLTRDSHKFKKRKERGGMNAQLT